MNKFLTAAKAWAALVGAVVSAVLATQAPGSVVYTVLTIVSVVATALATFRVPNADA